MSDRARLPDKDINTLSAAGNNDPEGIWSDGVTMWVADDVDDKLYAYTLSSGERDADKDFNTLSGSRNGSPGGLWSDGESIYVSDWNDRLIYKYIMIVPGTLNLSTITINGTEVAGFSGNVRSYEISDPYPLTSDVTLAATATNSNAKVVFSHADAIPGDTPAGHQIGLSEGENKVRIFVSGLGQASLVTYQLDLTAGDAPADSTSKARVAVDNGTGPPEHFRGAVMGPDGVDPDPDAQFPLDIDRINVSLTENQLYEIVLKGERFGDSERTLHIPYIRGLYRMGVYQSGTAALGVYVSSGIDGRARVLYMPSGSDDDDDDEQIDFHINVSSAQRHQTGTYDLQVLAHEDDQYPNGIGTESVITFAVEPEGDDKPDNFAKVLPSARVEGQINYAFDEDWFRVSDLLPGEAYLIEAREGHLEDEAEPHDRRPYLHLRVYDAEGEEVDVSHQGAKTVFRPSSDQDYYILVFPGNEFSRQQYTLYLHPPLPAYDLGGLTADRSIFDPDRSPQEQSLRYRWYRIGDDGEEHRIWSANQFVYVPTASDVGQRVFGQVCYRSSQLAPALECRYSRIVNVEHSGSDFPYTTTLAPRVEAGGGFRWLVFSEGQRTAQETDISVYNEWIQAQVRGGRPFFRGLADSFQALVSTSAVSALENTGTEHTSEDKGVPILWLGTNDLIAADYEAFWANRWEQRSPGTATNSLRHTFSDTDIVWTGTNTDGSGNLVLGGSTATVGRPVSESPVNSGSRSTGDEYSLFGLSRVLRVAEPDVPYLLRVGGARITSQPRHDEESDVPGNDTYGLDETIEFTLTFSEAVDVEGDPQFRFSLLSARKTDGLRQAAYQSGSGSTELVFTYTVLANDMTTTGHGITMQASSTRPPVILDGDDSITATDGGEDAIYHLRSIDFPGHEVNGSLTSSMLRQANSPATGILEISGLAQVRQTLAVNSAISDQDGTSQATYAYQWLADGAEISGATSITYTLTAAEQGKRITARISFTDDAGHEESLTSEATAAVAPPPDAATGQPQITGRAEVGQTLSAGTSQIGDTDGLTNAVYSYQWLANGTEISGATSSSHTLTKNEEGRSISVRVSFTDDAGNAESVTSAATGAVAPRPNAPATGRPQITGTARVGLTLSAGISQIADTDGLTNAVYSYQWLANGVEISGATSSSHTLTNNERHRRVSVRVSFTDDFDNAESVTSEPTSTVARRPNLPATGQPRITGTPLTGASLGVDTGGVEDPNGLTTVRFSYQWIVVDGTTESAISGATQSRYKVPSQHAGKPIKVRVSFTDDDGHRESLISLQVVASQPTGLSAVVTDQTIVLSWTRPAVFPLLFDYRIERQTPELGEDSAVVTIDTGASTTTYTDANVHPGVLYRYQVKAVNWWNHFSPASASVDIRLPQETRDDTSDNSPAKGRPQITGTAQVGQTLTAGTSAIADPDGLTNAVYSYQWLAGSTAISGATGSTFTLTASQQNRTITVRVSFTDDAGHAESVTSEPTSAVARRPNAPATGQPRITGTPLTGASLGVDTSGVEDPNGLTTVQFGYQWIVVDRDTESTISGATRSRYRVPSQYEGKAFKVRISFTDDDGYEESLISPQVVASQPTGLTAVVTEQTIVLSWTRPAVFPLLFDYRIERQTPELGEDSAVVTIDTGTSATTYTDANLHPGVLYRYQVKAVNWWNHFSPASTSVDIRLPQGTGTNTQNDSSDDTQANSPATGRPQITGMAQVGQTLTAGTSAIADPDGLTNAVYSYQWLAGGTAISGATGSTFTLTASQQNRTITVRVSFTDDAGHAESVTSAATSAVAAAPTSPPPAPSNLTGQVNADGGITLNWTAPSDDSVTGYLILRRRPREGERTLEIYVANTNSTATTYTDTSAPTGTLYVYRVKAINAAGVGAQSNYVNVDHLP